MFKSCLGQEAIGEVKGCRTENHVMTEEDGKDRVHTSVAGMYSMQEREPRNVTGKEGVHVSPSYPHCLHRQNIEKDESRRDRCRERCCRRTYFLHPTQDQEPLCLQPSGGWGSLSLTNFCSSFAGLGTEKGKPQLEALRLQGSKRSHGKAQQWAQGHRNTDKLVRDL